jgi:hypothetical protein
MSIRVDLVQGQGEQYWPRPGRIFAAARSHTFKEFADAIDDAFARWDRSHLQEFTLPGKPLPYSGWGDIPDQYRRRWDGDDGEWAPPRNPGLTGLPPLRPDWGPARVQPG